MLWYINKNKKKNSLETNISFKKYNEDNFELFIDGYIIPRYDDFEFFKNCDKYSLVYNLFNKYKFNFIEHIKGIFVIVIKFNKSYYIYNDIQGLNKFFIYEDYENIIISNNLDFITKNFNAEISLENIITFYIFNHFINGYTIFKNVMFSHPATKITLNSDSFKYEYYWNVINLFNNKISNISLEEIAFFWKELIYKYIVFLKPKEVSLTLTGGIDSRMVLAALLSKNINLNTFSFGNPNSLDVIISKLITEALSIKFNNYNVDNPSEFWFQKYSEKIISYGNSLINIHRAHRLDSIEKEKYNNPNSEVLFTGLVGGEYLKEPYYNNITIPVIFKLFLEKSNNKKFKIIYLKNIIKSYGFNPIFINIDDIIYKIDNFLYNTHNLNDKQAKFFLTFHYYGAIHHYQDTCLWSKFFNVINPFMDIDFLNILSQTKYWYVNNRYNFKLFHSYFQIKLTQLNNNELTKFFYAKKGYFTGDEILKSKTSYIFKRIIRYLFSSKSYAQNFPMSSWLYKFSYNELNNLHPFLKNFLNLNYLFDRLEKTKNYTTEEKWYIITHHINISKNLNYFLK